jgi:uncharacterized protein (TIGR02118 family)
MLKLLYLQRRLPGLTRGEFQEHWLDVHARFARELSAVLRYVQYATLEDDPIQQSLAQAADGREPYDGLTAAWFADEESFKAGMEHPLVGQALADERHFIDAGRSVALLVEERVQVEPTGHCPIVLVECLRRPAEIDRATFSERWHHHAAIGRKAAAAGLLAGYIQNHALPEGKDGVEALDEQGSSGERWDGVVTAYFRSLAIAKELFASPLAAEEAFDDERSFIDHDKGVYMLARRHVAKDLVR